MTTLTGPSPTLVPRAVFCPIEERHRDLERAEDACAGRFTNAGITLDLGPVPDWLTAPLPEDPEWQIEWWKLYVGLDLAWAFRATGRRRFLVAWELLVQSFAETVPVGADTSDVAARRLTNLVYAWGSFAAAPGFPGLVGGLPRVLLNRVAEEAAFVRDNLTPERNHRTLELYALLVAALALPSIDPEGELRSFAIGQLDRNLREDFRPDGVHREASSHYHLVALRSLLAARENARRHGLRFPRGFDRRLERACEFALHVHRPDGGIPALSDADDDGHPALLALAASLLGRQDFLYAATAGEAGTPPQACSVDFPDGGYFFQRSGWGGEGRPFRDERFLVFDCGPLGDGGHGHYDLLSIEVAAGGAPLVVDPGRGTYSEEGPENLRRLLKSTAAHNTVTVDGLDQTPYRRGKPGGPVAEAGFLGRFEGRGVDVLAGEATSPCYDARHRRRIVFVAGEYWVIEDELSAPTPHRYDLRFQLAAAAEGRTSLRQRGSSTVVRAPGVALVLAEGPSVRIEAGAVAPRYGVVVRAPVVSAVIEESCTATFLTLIHPLAGNGATPALEVLERGASTLVVVGERDFVGWSADGVESWWRRA